MTLHHKVGQMHYFGTILVDAQKYDMSGNTVAMYEKARRDESARYMVVEWDKDGQTEISTDKYEYYVDAVTRYMKLAFNR